MSNHLQHISNHQMRQSFISQEKRGKYKLISDVCCSSPNLLLYISFRHPQFVRRKPLSSFLYLLSQFWLNLMCSVWLKKICVKLLTPAVAKCQGKRFKVFQTFFFQNLPYFLIVYNSITILFWTLCC